VVAEVLVAKTPSDIPPLRLEAQAVVALIQILLQQGRLETLQQFLHLKVATVRIKAPARGVEVVAAQAPMVVVLLVVQLQGVQEVQEQLHLLQELP